MIGIRSSAMAPFVTPELQILASISGDR